MAVFGVLDLLRWLVNPERAVGRVFESAELAGARKRRLRQLRAQISSLPVLPMASCRDGLAGFQGRAQPVEVMPAPLSGRPVIGYRLQLEGVYQEDNAEKKARPLLDVGHVLEFDLIEDDTREVARVRPQRCLLLLAPEPKTQLELAAVIKPPLAPIVDRACVSPDDLASAVELHAVEHLLEPGEPVYAFGTAQRERAAPTPLAGYRATSWRRTLSPPPDGLLVLADRHHDALLDALKSQWELLPAE